MNESEPVPIFECPNCGGTAVAGTTMVEWVDFVGASRQTHVTCQETVVALPIDYGVEMEKYTDQ